MYHIYRITNRLDGNSYIGFTTQVPFRRFIAHKSLVGRGSKQHLHRAMRKYGIDNFLFEVLCWGENHNEGLELAEPLLIGLFNPKYNMTEGGEGTTGFTQSEETRSKIALAKRGVPRSHQTRQKISLAKMGKKMPAFSTEHKRNMSLSASRRMVLKPQQKIHGRFISHTNHTT